MPNKKKWTQMTLNPLFYLAAGKCRERYSPFAPFLAVGKCRERDSNPHNHFWSRDFKSLVSTIPPSRQLFCGCKGTAIYWNNQIFQNIFTDSVPIGYLFRDYS